MRKKEVLWAFGILAVVLTGCEKTPEDVVVREKGIKSIQEYESTESMGSSLYESLNVPKHYTNRRSYEDGRLVVDTDADIVLPDVDAISTYAVTAQTADQAMIDLVSEVFLPEAKFYHSEYLTNTKEDCRKKITELKKYKAEGNLDPYQYGKDENGAYYFDIDARIAQYEEEIKDAPKEKPKQEVRPSFGLTYSLEEEDASGEVVGDDYFYGVAESEDGLYTYGFNRMGPDIEFQITKIDNTEGMREVAYWVTGEELIDRKEDTERNWTEADMERLIELPYEEAEKIASEKVKKLGLGLTVYGWDYELCYRGNEEIQESSVIDGGYIFYFTRETGGVPVTYTSELGGVYEEDIGEELTFESWKYETCNIIVGNDGICSVELHNPYKVGSVQIENVKMMDFDSIIGIYEQMMEISNADLAADETLRTYHITRITLGYGRIYAPTVDNASGILVPVWDFFGKFDVEGDGYRFKDSGEHSTRSFLTINAIDGTIINREMGY